MQIIGVEDHPHNSDPSASLVSGTQERLSIFRVRAGFVPVLDGQTFLKTFGSEAEAREAGRKLEAA